MSYPTNHPRRAVTATDLPRLVGLSHLAEASPASRTFEQQLALGFPPLVGRSALLPPEALVPRPTPSSVELAFAEVAEAFRPVVDRYVTAFGIIRDSVLEHAARLRLEAEWGPRRTYDHEPWTPPALLADDPVPPRHSSVAGFATVRAALARTDR